MSCSPIPITTLAWSLCVDCMSLKVMMPIPASSPTFSSALSCSVLKIWQVNTQNVMWSKNATAHFCIKII